MGISPDTIRIMATPKGPIRAYRRAHNLRAEELAAKLGVAASTLRSWENGTRELPPDMAVKVERLCGIDRILTRPDIFRRKAA